MSFSKIIHVMRFVAFQHIRLQQRVVSRAAQCDAVVGKYVRVVLDVLSEFGVETWVISPYIEFDKGHLKPDVEFIQSVVLDLVASKSFRERGIYDVAEVRRIIDEHDRIVASGQPQENHMMFLWQLVNLELWLRWVDALPAAAA